MSPADLDQLRDRLARIWQKLESRAGPGFSQSHTFPDGATHRYKVNGVRQPEDFEDDLLAAFVWTWSIKDHLRQVAVNRGKDPKRIEEIVNAHLPLQLVADVANTSKHGSLRDSRSGKFARLDRTTLVVPGEAMSSLTIGAYDVTLNVSDPAKARFEARVVGHDGEPLGEAADVLRTALGIWEAEAMPYVLGT